MSDNTTPRLMAAAREFNIGKDTLVDFLVQKGFKADDLGPNTKLTDDQYRVLQHEFASDKVAKQKAEQLDLPKGASAEPVKKKKDELPVLKPKTESKKEEKKEEVQPTPQEQPAVKEVEVLKIDAPVLSGPKIVEQAPKPAAKAKKEKPVQPELPFDAPVEEKPIVEKIEAPKIEGPKIGDKIDLSLIDSSTRPKKSAKKQEEPKEELVEKEKPEQVKAPEKIEVKENIPPAVVAPTIENIRAEKLEGPKILGKIELPVDSETRPKRDPLDKRKRKRITVEKKIDPKGNQFQTGNKPVVKKDPQNRNQPGTGPNRGGGNNRPGGGPNRGGNRVTVRRDDKVIDQKEIQEKLKETQAKLAGSGNRGGKSIKAKMRKQRREEQAEMDALEASTNKIQVSEFVSVSELANMMDVSFAEVIGKCMSLGLMVSINQRLEADVIELVAGEFDFEVEFIGVDEQENYDEEEEADLPENLKPRAPIVTIMGHVDHGKTSLLDYIRNTNIIAGEAGGITQHIGAYEVTIADGRKIAFLDTPGHEAFTAMRARGAKVTDIAVIVVAADDAVMPQTKEAISHAQAANVPMIFAINKVDKDGANPEKIKEQLAGLNILVEDWGGSFQSQELSAKQGLNVDLLMDKILLQAEMLELKANPSKVANGTIIEASLDKGRGYVATVLVQNGTLNIGDTMLSGQHFGKIKAMYNERNQKVETAPPSTPVLILGLNGAPQAGETFKVYNDESEAKELATKRGQIIREQGMRARKHITLDEIGRRLALGNFKELNVIIKGDVDGSVEALSDSLQKLSTDEIVVRVIHKGVGAITESDVTLASASDAIIIGFNVRPSVQANRLAEAEAIQIKMYSIIYAAIDEIKSAMEGMLEPTTEEKILANVEIRETYKFDKVTVAGCYVLDGKISRNNRIRIVRDGIVVYTGELGSLKRFKDDVKEVATNYECGLSIKNYANIQVGDIVEAFEEVEVKRSL